MERRDFIKYLPLAFVAIATGCRRPSEKTVPRIYPGSYTTPGVPEYFNTVYSFKNVAYGITVKTYEGRPVKIDGNPKHPINIGRSNAQMQASLYSLYDPERFFKPKVYGKETSIHDTLAVIKKHISNETTLNNQVRILIDEHCSPSLETLIRLIEKNNDNVRFITVPPLYSNSIQSDINKNILGINGAIIPDLSKAEYALSFGADILGTDKNSLYHTIEYAKKRESNNIKLVTIESSFSLTGANSDKQIPIRPDEIQGVVESLLYNYFTLNKQNDLIEEYGITNKYDSSEIKSIAEELIQYSDKSIVLSADYSNYRTQYLITVLNLHLGNIGDNNILSPSNVLLYNKNTILETNTFRKELAEGKISSVIFLDLDLAYFGKDLFDLIEDKVPNSNLTSISIYPNQTSKKCSISIPMAHYLECWGDAVCFDGTTSIQQPIIKPLNGDSIGIGDLLINLFNESCNSNHNSFYDFVREQWLDEKLWEKILRNGFVRADNSIKTLEINPNMAKISIPRSLNITGDELTVLALPSNTLATGEFSENRWLRELPDPITKTVWDNYVILSPTTAKNYDLKNGDIVEIVSDNGDLELPVYILDGIADNCIITFFGYGKKQKSRTNAFSLLSFFAGNRCYVKNISINKTGRKSTVLSTQNSDAPFSPIYKDDKAKLPSIIQDDQNFKYKLHHWAMAVDLDLCTGCSACVSACQIENNIAVVGREEYQNNRSMQWLRIEKYKDNNNNIIYYPIMCQHCDNAPCESVCPVSATTHSPEGINEMTYNRCIGTRYCMANCPYNARRFNFKDYHKKENEQYKHLYNPEVTVRMRGIVEKCTFCVQRINEARYKSKNSGSNTIPDGMMKTACQQACPSGAITFGNLLDDNSEVSRKIKAKTAIRLLEELNTSPSVYYLRSRKDNKHG